MNHRIKIRQTDILSDNWAKFSSITLDYQRRDGEWQTMTREIHDHGHAAAVLPINPETSKIILVRQFRLPPHLNGDDGWLLEIPAGLLDEDDPKTCAAREVEEETGFKVTNLRHAMTAIASPGTLTEKVHIFIGDYTNAAKVSNGGGLEDEGEDIEVIEMDFDVAMTKIATGEITDAKTIIALQYAALHKLV